MGFFFFSHIGYTVSLAAYAMYLFQFCKFYMRSYGYDKQQISERKNL